MYYINFDIDVLYYLASFIPFFDFLFHSGGFIIHFEEDFHVIVKLFYYLNYMFNIIIIIFKKYLPLFLYSKSAFSFKIF